MKIEEKQDVQTFLLFLFYRNMKKEDQSSKSRELGSVGLKFLTMLFTD